MIELLGSPAMDCRRICSYRDVTHCLVEGVYEALSYLLVILGYIYVYLGLRLLPCCRFLQSMNNIYHILNAEE